jgi:hypothetical protein
MPIYLVHQRTTNAMTRLFTPCQNEQVVALVTRAFDADGMLVSKGKRKNQKEAHAILDSGADTSGYVGRYEAHTSVLIIAYPNKQI